MAIIKLGFFVGICQVLFLVFLTTPLQASNEITAEKIAFSGKDDSNHPLALRDLGSVDGKTYFADLNNTKSWTSARAHCEESNLEMAVIETENEADFLIEALAPYGTGQIYWMGARPAGDVTMLRWDGGSSRNSTGPSLSVFRRGAYFAGIDPVCGGFYFSSSGINFYIHPCSMLLRTVCQSKSII